MLPGAQPNHRAARPRPPPRPAHRTALESKTGATARRRAVRDAPPLTRRQEWTSLHLQRPKGQAQNMLQRCHARRGWKASRYHVVRVKVGKGCGLRWGKLSSRRMRTVGVLRADREEHRPRGRARNGVHELDFGDVDRPLEWQPLPLQRTRRQRSTLRHLQRPKGQAQAKRLRSGAVGTFVERARLWRGHARISPV